MGYGLDSVRLMGNSRFLTEYVTTVLVLKDRKIGLSKHRNAEASTREVVKGAAFWSAVVV